MKQNPFSEANSRSASQIPCLLWDPEGSLPCSQDPAAGRCFYKATKI
jgi:hypothetical protein